MGEEFKTKLVTFISNIVNKIERKELIPEIQQELDELIEEFEKLVILTNEESENLEKEMNKYEIYNKKYQEEIKIMKIQIESDNEKIKSLEEGLSKNSALKEQFNKLDEDYNILKQKRNLESNEIKEYQNKLNNNEKLINDLQNELNKVKIETYERKVKILNYEKTIKQNNTKLNENNELIIKINKEKTELTKLNEELRKKIRDKERTYENKIKMLEKQLKHLSEANNNFVQENNEVQTQLKDFQLLTNMAKVNTKKLNKEDFSILEIMSKRAESAEMEVQKLLSYIEELKQLNEQIRSKISPLEDYVLLQIKHDHEISLINNTISDIRNKIFTEEEKKEIYKLKNEPKELFQTLIRLKAENLELHKHIKDITIECNQQLREAKWKNK
jgi:N-terminal acetyltransferase B complex non-catalytic subunit